MASTHKINFYKYTPNLLTGILTVLMLTNPQIAYAEKISNIYMFGDSSADVGTDGNRYSNLGKMWIESVSEHLGFASTPSRYITPAADGSIDLSTAPITKNNGTNYAVGGATTMPFTGIVTFDDEINFFKQEHKGFNKNDLVFLWFGSNDAATSTLNGIPYDPSQYAAAYMNGVKELKKMGAKNLVAMAEPENLLPEQYLLDLGIPMPSIDGQKQDIHNSNTALWPELKMAGVYVIDNNKLANDVMKDISKYGFTVGTEGYMTLGDPRSLPNDGHIFSDAHYSSQMHDVISDYTIAQLRARDQSITLLQQPLKSISKAFYSIEPLTSGDAFSNRSPSEWKWHGNTGMVYNTSKSTGGTDIDSTQNAVDTHLAGDVVLSNGLLVGLQLSYNFDKGDFAKNSGDYTQHSITGSTYAAHKIGTNGFANIALSYGSYTYSKIRRTAKLGNTYNASTTGDTEGNTYAAKVTTGADLPIDDWTLTPTTSLSYNRVRQNSYQDENTVLGLSHGSADLQTLNSAIDLAIKRSGNNHTFQPYAKIGVEHDFMNDDLQIKIGPTQNMLVNYNTERPSPSKGRLTIGTDYQITPLTTLNLNIVADKSFGQNTHQQDVSTRISLKSNF